MPTYNDPVVTYNSLLWTYNGNSTGPTPPLTSTPGSSHTPHSSTLNYWESERLRLRALRDDDELLLLL